jgi:DNA polymerase III sliding clamp (beta) subunit (PCNA family)
MLSLEKFDGDDIESRFYSPYLLNGLQAFSDTALQFYIKNGTKPIIFEAESNDCHLTFLVMPISITQADQAG